MHVMMTVNAAWNIWNFRRPLIIQLLADGHQVTVAAPRDDSVAELKALGCTFIPFDMKPAGLNPLDGIGLAIRYRRLFRTQRPDIILSYTIKSNIFGAMAARISRIPFLPNVTGLGTAFLAGGLVQSIAERLYRVAFRNLPIIFFQNVDDRALFLARGLVAEGQGRLLPGSGINLARFSDDHYPEADDGIVFLMIARLLKDKGVIEFVEAARMVGARHRDVRFQLLGAVGSDNRTAIGRETVSAWVAEGVVEYLGTTADVRPCIARAHCIVLPSYREGAPRTLIEAAAMSRPLIATDVPGCRAVVDHGELGLLCPARDVAGLAAAFATFMALPHEARRAMGKAGRAKMVAEFDEAVVVSAYQEAIAELTAS
ncbi:MAG: glycosyltransferase family 4 protein [Minwuia sp.]|uniref:glycosyltransferase family 4 protein n=1 Tax=Minwuia sp. TaxID=2493630 RepID=UPI003A88C4D1